MTPESQDVNAAVEVDTPEVNLSPEPEDKAAVAPEERIAELQQKLDDVMNQSNAEAEEEKVEEEPVKASPVVDEEAAAEQRRVMTREMVKQLAYNMAVAHFAQSDMRGNRTPEALKNAGIEMFEKCSNIAVGIVQAANSFEIEES